MATSLNVLAFPKCPQRRIITGRRQAKWRRHVAAAEELIIRTPSPCSGTLQNAVQRVLGCDPDHAEDLIHLGAVWYGFELKGSPGLRWKRAVVAAANPTQLQVVQGQQIRIHPQPKRYPACHTTDWASALLHMDEEFVVVNKPHALPCMPHESNSKEHLQECASRALSCGQLQVCHRLDQWTTGVVVLGRHKAALARFTKSMELRAMHKTYRAITQLPLEPGTRLMHHMYDGPFGSSVDVVAGGALFPRGPRLLSQHALPGWKHCELVIQDCKVAQAGVEQWHARCFPGQTVPEVLYDSTILLLTGRTHQIRAQLASMCAPIVGDVMYGSIPGLMVGADGVLAAEEAQQAQRAPQLSSHVGLHAWQLQWEGRVYQAPAPWD